MLRGCDDNVSPRFHKTGIRSDLCFLPGYCVQPYVLSKSRACSAASMTIFQGLKAANHHKKCPVCREAGVYANSVHMIELDLLVKNRYAIEHSGMKFWTKEREMVKRW